MLLLFQGVQGSTLVECPKGKNCEDKCGENILFSLGDQESSMCRYFKPSEIIRMARETYKLDRVNWLCSNNHKVKGVSAVKYTVFIADLFSSHGIKGQGLMHPEAVSAKRKCLVQCAKPSIDLKSGFPDIDVFGGGAWGHVPPLGFSKESIWARF